MCITGGWFVSTALFFGSIQSVAWMALSAVGGLVYLCVIPVPPYKDSSDFFMVTTVKLYFEGPECIPDGSYLGRFNEDYRNREVLALFTPDRVFAVMVTYFIVNAAYFILSMKCWLNLKPKSSAEAGWVRELLFGWSVITLTICAIDVIFTAKMISDIISLKDYMGDKSEHAEVYKSIATGNKAEIPYIALLLALISSKFIGIWLWNFFIGLIFFFNALCSRNLFKFPSKIVKEQEPPKPSQTTQDVQTSPRNQPKETYISAYDIRSHSDFSNLKKSSEDVTNFSTSNPTTHPKDNIHNWSYAPADVGWQVSKANTSKDSWERTNEGYDSDEQVEPEKRPDFDHDLKNFEQGQRKIKIMKPPIGKPVSIPVPPPLPTSRTDERVKWQKKSSQRVAVLRRNR